MCIGVANRASFATANKEFVEAFDDYKKGEFSESVVKSCAAYESVMKVICKQKGWPCDQSKATPGDLVSTIISNGKLDEFLSEPLKMIGMIRNKKSIAHGGGTSPKDVSESLARYCLNATASSILFIVESTR